MTSCTWCGNESFLVMRYNRKQNKCYPQNCQTVRKNAVITAAHCNEKRSQYQIWFNNMLLWASKFTTAKIECTFDVWQVNTFGGNAYFAGYDTHD